MKLPPKYALPTHIPMRYVCQVLVVLMGVQVLEGTSFFTSLIFCVFTLVATDAFNTCGGLVYPSGAYVFALGLFGLILPGFCKTILGESLESNLQNVQKGMLVYLAGMLSLWVAAKINIRIRRKKPLTALFQISEDRLKTVVAGCLFVGFIGPYLLPESILSSFQQANKFLALALLLQVYIKTKKTNGNTTFSPTGFMLWAVLTIIGIAGIKKEAMFGPSFIWIMGALSAGYRASVKKLVFLGALAVVAIGVLIPLSQVGRDVDEANRAKLFSSFLENPMAIRGQYLKDTEQNAERARRKGKNYIWFDKPLIFVDRIALFPVDNGLILITDGGRSPGVLPLLAEIRNLLPRYLIGKKSDGFWRNYYGREIHIIGANDLTTGISFSVIGELYHCARWRGVILIGIPCFLLMFWVCDSTTGSVKQTHWALLYLLYILHGGVEAMFGGVLYTATTYSLIVIGVAFIASRVMPVIGSMLVPTRPSFSRSTYD